MAVSMVISGIHEGAMVSLSFRGRVYIQKGLLKRIYLNKDTIEAYKVKEGLAEDGDCTVRVKFKDGKGSVIRLNKNVYRFFLQSFQKGQ